MIIVDTNVIIDIERGKSSLKSLFAEFLREHYVISAISVMELYSGLGYTRKVRGDAFYQKQKGNIDLILSDFEILAINLPILKNAGIKRGDLYAQGIIIDNEDIIIGTTAEFFEIPIIITRNQKHFANFKLKTYTY